MDIVSNESTFVSEWIELRMVFPNEKGSITPTVKVMHIRNDWNIDGFGRL